MNDTFEAIDGIVTINDKRFYQSDDGSLIPEGVVKPSDKLEDDSVRKMIGYAQELSDQIARFKEHSFEDFFTAVAIINEEYGIRKGGKKNNITLQTIDGLMKVQVRVSEIKKFGPQLQAAKELIDECISTWAEGARRNSAFAQRSFWHQERGQDRPCRPVQAVAPQYYRRALADGYEGIV